MASFRLSPRLFLLLLAFFFLYTSVRCNEDEDKLLEGINEYRRSLNLSALVRNGKAACLADIIAEQLEDEPCSSAEDFNKAVGNEPRFSNFKKLLKRCNIDVKTSMDGIILPVCIPKLELDYVLNNYTHSDYSSYLKNSNFTGAGVGSAEDWIVVILSSNSSTGSFSSSASIASVSLFAILPCLLTLLLRVLVSF